MGSSTDNRYDGVVVQEEGESSNVNPNVLAPMVGGNPNKKTLVLDLDGTLVHSSWMPTAAGYDFIITLKGYKEPIYLLIRPGVDELLQQLGSTGLYEIVIFRVGCQCCVDAIVDTILDSLPPSSSSGDAFDD